MNRAPTTGWFMRPWFAAAVGFVMIAFISLHKSTNRSDGELQDCPQQKEEDNELRYIDEYPDCNLVFRGDIATQRV